MTADASCPRCGGSFHCGANDATPCACTRFTLTAETAQRLREQFSSCVCMACLAQLQAHAPSALAAPLARAASPMPASRRPARRDTG